MASSTPTPAQEPVRTFTILTETPVKRRIGTTDVDDALPVGTYSVVDDADGIDPFNTLSRQVTRSFYDAQVAPLFTPAPADN